MKRFVKRKENFGYILYDRLHDKFWTSKNKDLEEKQITLSDYSKESIPYGLKIKKNFNLISPISVGWMISGRCNAKCLHCYAFRENLCEQELTLKQIKKIIRDLSFNKVFRIDLSGGEPLVRQDINEIISYAVTNKLSVILSTNGYLLEKIDLSSLSAIQVSLDSIDGKKHDYFRGFPGLHEKVIKNLKKLDGNSSLRIFSVLSKLNIDEIDELTKFCFDLGAKEHQYLRYIPSGRGQINKDEFYLGDKEYKKVMKKIIKIKRKYGGKMIVECIDLSKNDQSYCLIRPNGDLVTLSKKTMDYVKVGNLLDDSIRKLWKNKHFNRLGHLKIWTDEGFY